MPHFDSFIAKQQLKAIYQEKLNWKIKSANLDQENNISC